MIRTTAVTIITITITTTIKHMITISMMTVTAATSSPGAAQSSRWEQPGTPGHGYG